MILRGCLGACRINHLLRSLDFEDGEVLACEVAKIIKQSFEQLLGAACDPVQFGLARLPVPEGGLGLRNPEHSHAAAYLASAVTFAARSTEALPHSFWETLRGVWNVVSSKYHLESTLTEEVIEAMSSPPAPATATKIWGQQRWWQQQVDTEMEAVGVKRSPAVD